VGAVSWSEQLKGWFSETQADFNQALREGKGAGRCIDAQLSIEIDDVDRFISSERKQARVSDGVVSCPELGGDLAVEWGVFELLVPGSQPPDHLHLRMRYRLNLRHSADHLLGLRGFKVVENDPGYDSWSDTSTLFVRIYKRPWDQYAGPGAGQARPGEDEAERVSELDEAPAGLAAAERFLGETALEDDDALLDRDILVLTAVMEISPGGFLCELLTFRGTGESRRARLTNIMRYGRCFGEGLIKAYGGPAIADGCASFPRDYQRAPWSAGAPTGTSVVPGREQAEWLPAVEQGEPQRARYALECDVVPFEVKDLAFPLNLHHVKALQRADEDPYPDSPGSRGPVLLVHGAGVRAEMFYGQPLGQTMVDYLLHEGYDVWIENWRASIDVPNNSYTLDRAAKFDHPAAVEKVMELTAESSEGKPLRALVHCQGSVSFVMAAAAGYLRKWPISNVVSSTISLFFEVPFKTLLKQRAMLPAAAVFGTGADPQWGIRAPTPSGGLLARISRFAEPECGNAACQIANYIYGSGPDVLLRHENVADSVHEWTSRELGYTPFSLIAQVAESCRYGHVVPGESDRAVARPSYVAREPRIGGAHFTFLGGGRDRMFLPSGQRRTAEFFKRFGLDADYVHLDGYGHMDVFWGNAAWRDVFPVIGAGLAKAPRRDQ